MSLKLFEAWYVDLPETYAGTFTSMPHFLIRLKAVSVILPRQGNAMPESRFAPTLVRTVTNLQQLYFLLCDALRYFRHLEVHCRPSIGRISVSQPVRAHPTLPTGTPWPPTRQRSQSAMLLQHLWHRRRHRSESNALL
jgi:hypothetical protein